MSVRKRRERRYLADQEAIVFARKRRDLTQRELAEKADVHYSLIAQFETGRCTLSDAVLERVANVLEVDVAFLTAKKAS